MRSVKDKLKLKLTIRPERISINYLFSLVGERIVHVHRTWWTVQDHIRFENGLHSLEPLAKPEDLPLWKQVSGAMRSGDY